MQAYTLGLPMQNGTNAQQKMQTTSHVVYNDVRIITPRTPCYPEIEFHSSLAEPSRELRAESCDFRHICMWCCGRKHVVLCSQVQAFGATVGNFREKTTNMNNCRTILVVPLQAPRSGYTPTMGPIFQCVYKKVFMPPIIAVSQQVGCKTKHEFERVRNNKLNECMMHMQKSECNKTSTNSNR